MSAVKWTRRQRRALSCAVLLCLAVGLWILVDHDVSRHHYLSTDLAHISPIFNGSEQALLPPDEAESACRAHGFYVESGQEYQRKVYDLVLMSTELDWLEIRLHTLSRYVDYFVIIESPTTFTGKTKPLHLRENWDLFENFHHMIIYRVVEDPVQSHRIWDHEDYLRNALFKEVFPGLTGTTQQANTGDVLVVSDMDEIVRPGAMLLLRYCSVPARLTLRTHFYYYSFQWRHRGPQWAHPEATVYRGSGTIMPNDLRQGLLGDGWAPVAALRRWWDRGTLWNAGWHCSSCFATIAEIRTKMHSFSHQGWNTPNNRDARKIVYRVRHGKDLFGRESELYDMVINNEDVPPYLSEQYEQRDRFGYLIDRDKEGAGFGDGRTVT